MRSPDGRFLLLAADVSRSAPASRGDRLGATPVARARVRRYLHPDPAAAENYAPPPPCITWPRVRADEPVSVQLPKTPRSTLVLCSGPRRTTPAIHGPGVQCLLHRGLSATTHWHPWTTFAFPSSAPGSPATLHVGTRRRLHHHWTSCRCAVLAR